VSRSLHLTTVIALGLVVCCAAGCGYLLGPSNVQGVRTIHVPIFKSDSFRRNLDYLLTEAVHKEIKLRTGYKLADADSADTVLEGRITDARKSAQTFPIGQELAMHSSQVNFAAEVGHSLATAQQEAVQRLAGQIVDLTEMPW
jgi:hypothetical protein